MQLALTSLSLPLQYIGVYRWAPGGTATAIWVLLLLALGIYGAVTYVVRGSTTCNAHVTVCKLW
jgi:hypothetical protein